MKQVGYKCSKLKRAIYRVKMKRSHTKALLLSQGIQPTPDAIEQCLLGWNEAAANEGATRTERVRGLNLLRCKGGPYAIGYCSFAYMYLAFCDTDG